jgi:hypothetical protein
MSEIVGDAVAAAISDLTRRTLNGPAARLALVSEVID